MPKDQQHCVILPLYPCIDQNQTETGTLHQTEMSTQTKRTMICSLLEIQRNAQHQTWPKHAMHMV